MIVDWRPQDKSAHVIANAEAIEHGHAARALGYPHRAELHAAIGELQTLEGDYAGALASYETAAANCA